MYRITICLTEIYTQLSARESFLFKDNLLIRGYPAKRALSAMRKHAKHGG